MAGRRFISSAILAMCLAVAVPAWAGTLQFNGLNPNGQGALSFTPGIGNTLTIGAGDGGSGGLETDFFNTVGFCIGDCSIVGGYITLSTGPETGGFANGSIWSYQYGAGGTLKITGEIPFLGINSPTVLFMAAFLPGTTFSGSGTVGSFLGQINLATIALAAQLGTYQYSGASNDELTVSIDPGCAGGGVCTGDVIQSLTTVQTIPEPGTLSVLGVGLFFCGAGLHWRMARRALIQTRR
jgi:PEP-CTERM motif